VWPKPTGKVAASYVLLERSSPQVPAGTRVWSLVIGHWLLVIGYWSLVIGYWLLVIGYWLLVNIQSSIINHQ